MRAHLYNLGISAGLFVLLFISCSPFHTSNLPPEIQKVDVVVGDNSLEFSAVLESDKNKLLECGFMYGTSEKDMIKVVSKLKTGTFSSRVEDIPYNTRYHLYAYVSNGQNVIRSDVYTFWTSAPPPEPEPEPEPEPDSEPDPEPEEKFKFSLPYDQLTFTAYYHMAFGMKTFGNVEYDVIVPDDVNWIRVDSDGIRNRLFYITANCTTADRTCDLVFTSLDHDCQLVLKVVQEHLDIPVITKPYSRTTFYIEVENFKVGLAVFVDDLCNSYVPDWCTCVALGDNRVRITMQENNTGEPRQVTLCVTRSSSYSTDRAHKLYYLIQNPK